MLSGKGIIKLWERIAGPGWSIGLVLTCFVPAAIFAFLFVWQAHFKNFGWNVLQSVVAILITFDICGGAIFFNTPQAKKWFHRNKRDRIRDFLPFNLIHIHPFIIAWVFFPVMKWNYAISVYAIMVISTIVIVKLPKQYKGQVAAIVVVMGCRVAEVLEVPPQGYFWFEPVYYMKLLLGHCVPPYGSYASNASNARNASNV